MVLTSRQKIIAYNKWLGTDQVIAQRFSEFQSARTMEYILIDDFRDIPMDSQTTDITHFAVVFHYDVTIKTLEILRSTWLKWFLHREVEDIIK